MALLSTLTDTFEPGTALDPGKWTPTTTNSGSYFISGSGALGLNIAGSTSATVRVISATTYTFDSVYVKVTPSNNATNGASTQLFVSTGGPESIKITIANGQVTATITNTAGSVVQNFGGTYNPTTQQWWRLRYTTGTVNFDFSADGSAWNAFGGPVNYTLSTSLVTFNMYAAANGATANTGVLFDNVNTTGVINAAPNSTTDGETIGAPAAAVNLTTAPGSTTDPEDQGRPTLDYTYAPASTSDPETITGPQLSYNQVLPDSAVDLESIDRPSIDWRPFYSGGYGTGVYGDDLYSGYWIGPDSVTDPDTLGAPGLDYSTARIPSSVQDLEVIDGPTLTGTAVPAGLDRPYSDGTYGTGIYPGGNPASSGAVFPDPVMEPEVIDGPTATGDIAVPQTNYGYGAGQYGAGPYVGTDEYAAGETTNPTDNPTYGTGTYGYGLYYGQTADVPDPIEPEQKPLFPPADLTVKRPLHILGIGPWNPTVEWRGAVNHGIGKGKLPARPALAMPRATAQSFTLRLGAGCEASAEFSFPRGMAVVVEEMVTDLWWRRKDPYTGKLEMMGRFNCSHVDLSADDDTITVSCAFEDYRQILGERVILRYLHPDPDMSGATSSQYKKNTPVTDVLAFFLPKNTGIDLSAVTGDDKMDLGVTTAGFTVPPGATIEQLMTNLSAISEKPWEWWVEQPVKVTEAPKLSFFIGTRGVDRGVTLFDYGKGPTWIKSWTRRATSDTYANSLYLTNSNGGFEYVIDAAVEKYGQRDTVENDSTIASTRAAFDKAAAKRLADLSTRTPTYTLVVKPGWWKGRSHVDVGDTLHIAINLGKEKLRESYRVQEISVAVDDIGAETVTFTLGNPLPATDPRSKQSTVYRMVRKMKKYETPPNSDSETWTNDTSM